MADRPAPLRIGRLRVRAESVQAARKIAAEFGAALSPIPSHAPASSGRMTLQAKGDSGGRAAARALSTCLAGGRDG